MSQNKSMLIFGNGPSARELTDFGLHNIRSDVDTFGMGNAYRYFRKINWWPTYYALGDSKAVFSHRKELAQVVEDPNVTTKRFFFSWPVSEHPRFERIRHSSTGDFCFRKSLELRYQNIYLIGIEGHYVEKLLESRPLSSEEYDELEYDQLNLPDSLRTTLRIISKTPDDNPNYFFPGYQQRGDVYSLPQSNVHRNRWSAAAELAESVDARVLNLSSSSKISDLPKTTISNIADQLLNVPATNPIQTEESDRVCAHADDDNTTPQVVPITRTKTSYWYGPFDRDCEIQIDEAHVVFDLFQSAPRVNPQPIMVDVGADKSGAYKSFANQNWTVHAFEPNPQLFDDLTGNFNLPNATLNGSAAGSTERDKISFCSSENSIGTRSLPPYRSTHEVTEKVKTVTLDEFILKQEFNRIEFLKIDTNEFDLLALKGIDLTRHSVDVILCEFEDSKTIPLGFTTNDLAEYLESFGYTVYVSEWHPIIHSGVRPDWCALKRYPCELEDPNSWGNLIAFKSDPGIFAVTKAINQRMICHGIPKRKQAVAKKIRQSHGRRRRKNRLRKIKRALERPFEQFARVAHRQVFQKKQTEGDERNDGSRRAA